MEKEKKLVLARIIISLILFILSFFSFASNIGKIIICLVAYLIIGYEVIWNSIKNIIHGKIFDENFLMVIATVGALATQEYSEAVAVMLFYEIGEFLQDLAVDNSKKSISKLMDIRPDYANLVTKTETKKVSPENVNVGDIIVVYAGEKIPLDGVVTEGKSSLNTMALTGESLPQEITIGDSVASGCINLTGVLTIKVTKAYAESTVAKILKLIENADSKKANSEKFITKFAKYYTPSVVLLAVLIMVIPPLVFGQNWTEWLKRALTFLVISCPCALVVSIPLSFFAGIGGAAKKGILVKGANYLEDLSNVSAVAFDKTGTLTKGSFAISVIHPNVISEDELLKICALAESNSSHPIAKSIVSAYNKKLDENTIKDIENLSGFGIKANIDGKITFVGNAKLMQSIGVEFSECNHTGTIVHVAINNQYMGHIEIIDEIKPQSKDAIDDLKNLGVKNIVMLTGDKERVARKICEQVSINEYYFEQSPTDKVEKIKQLQSEGKKVVFVGDGINDAPVLKTSNIGMAMGGLGSDAAIESSDIVIMDDNPKKIATSIKIARKTMRLVKENISFALTIKISMLILGAFGIVGMWLAVFADVGVSLIAILNSLRALKIKN